MNFKCLLDELSYLLEQPLPGDDSHIKMSPYKRANASLILKSNKKPNMASVLLLLYLDCNDNIMFPLIKRTNYRGTHGGQISLPGGKLENNESLKNTAIRETEEEIGVNKNSIKLLGKLTQVYTPPSNFLITPFVGFVNKKPKYFINKREVDFVFDVNIKDLIDDSSVKTKKIPITKYEKENMYIKAPYYDLENQIVWGATALILSEFKDILLNSKTIVNF